MRWLTVMSDQDESEVALDEVVGDLQRGLGGASPDLLLVFASPHHGEHYGAVAALLAAAFPQATLVGCSGAGVIGGGHELEGVAALSVTAAVLPDVGIRVHHLPADIVGREVDDAAVEAALDIDPDLLPGFLVLAEPFSTSAEALVDVLDALYPRAVKVGGLASGARRPGDNALMWGSEAIRHGALVVALWGNIELSTAVAQGCRPLGASMRITEMKDDAIVMLDESPATEVVERLLRRLEPRTRMRFQRSPMVGVAMDPFADHVGPGDFLIRHVVGFDPEAGQLLVNHEVEVGDIIQFHARDPEASAADLEAVVAGARRHRTSAPKGALLFSCLGRGAGFYGVADHDTGLLRARMGGDLAVGGLFCNGEIGQVHGRTFLHGYTSAIALFDTPEWN